MMRSMTAFAAREADTPQGRLAIEIRSVNHRFLELSLRLPEEFRALEMKLRERVAARVQRGKVDLALRFRAAEGAGLGLKLNEPLARELAQLQKELSILQPDLSHGTRLEALAWPGMIVEPDRDLASLHEAALALLDGALDDFIANREREGARLAELMRERMAAIDDVVARLKVLLPEIRVALRARLDARLADLKQPLDPGRIEQELVLQLQKIDVDEELDRLATHLIEARRVLSGKEAAGRRLDFLLQEFNRESNTLGSKSVDARTSQASVDLKVLIEQIREQVQNLE